jgi:hypothetical protein
MSKDVNDSIDKLNSTSSKVEQFSDLLDSLSKTEDKKKMLWREIYENAIVDRENASILFTDAWKHMSGGTSEHATLGGTLTKYLERMCKSNEQILRLAELIAKAEVNESQLDPDDIFSKIDGG